MQRVVSAGVALALVAILGGCASSNPDVIKRSDAQRLAQVEDGVVLSVRSVVVDGSQSGIGGVVGGAVGAIGGASGSSVNRESQVLGVLGAVAGAAAGNAIERMTTKEDAVELLIQFKSGDRRAVVQAKGGETLVAGDAVIIITTGGKVRVTKAPKV